MSTCYKDLRVYFQKVSGQCFQLAKKIQKTPLKSKHVQGEALKCLKQLSHILSIKDRNLKYLCGLIDKLSQPGIREIDQKWPKQMRAITHSCVMIRFLMLTQQGKSAGSGSAGQGLSQALAVTLKNKAYHSLLMLVKAELDLKLLLPNKQMLWVEILRAIMREGDDEVLEGKQALEAVILNFIKNNQRHVLKNGQAHTLLKEAVDCKNAKITIALIISGAKLSRTKQETLFLGKICTWITIGPTLETSTRTFLAQLIKQHALPFEELNEGSLLISTILKSQDVVLKKLVNEHYFLTPSIHGALLCLNAKGKSLIEIEDLCAELKLMQAMQKTIDFLKGKWDSAIQDYCKEPFYETRQRAERAQKWIEENEGKGLLPIAYRPEGNYAYWQIDNALARDALSMCYMQNKLQLIGPLLSRLLDFEVKHFNQAQANFLLDKWWIGLSKNKHMPLPFRGGFLSQNALLFASAMNRRLKQIEGLKQPNAEQGALKQLYGNLVNSLLLCAKWEYEARQCKKYSIVAQEIVEKLKDLQRLVPLVIPIGAYQHAMLLTVEILDGEVSMGVTNSGWGIDKFHSKQGALYQTTITAKVQLTSLLKIGLWENLLSLQESLEIADFYAAFKELGLQDPPSVLQCDYGYAQMRESCSAQAIVKWFKYIICTHVEGSAAAKIGVYKTEKDHLLLDIGAPNAVDDFLKPGVEQKINKRHVFKNLHALAENHRAFVSIWKSACRWLKATGHKETSKQLKELQLTNVSEKAYFLREWTYMLAWERLMNPTDLFWFPIEARMKKIWGYSTVLLAEKQRVKNQIEDALNQHKAAKAWKDLIEMIVLSAKSSPYWFLAFDWLAEQIKIEEQAKQSVFKEACMQAIEKELQDLGQKRSALNGTLYSPFKNDDYNLSQAFGFAIQGKPLPKKHNWHRMRHFIGQDFHERRL